MLQYLQIHSNLWPWTHKSRMKIINASKRALHSIFIWLMFPDINIFHTDSFFLNSLNFVNTIHMIAIIGCLLLLYSEPKKRGDFIYIEHLCVNHNHSNQNNKLFCQELCNFNYNLNYLITNAWMSPLCTPLDVINFSSNCYL